MKLIIGIAVRTILLIVLFRSMIELWKPERKKAKKVIYDSITDGARKQNSLIHQNGFMVKKVNRYRIHEYNLN